MRHLWAVLGLVAASCAQAEYREVVLASRTVLNVREAEIAKERSFGTPAGKVILSVELIGEGGRPVKVTADPYVAIGSYLQVIRSACGDLSEPASGFREIAVSDRLLRNFLGEMVNGGESFSILVDNRVCGNGPITEETLYSSPTFTCGAISSGDICILEIKEASYFAHLTLRRDEVPRWKEIADRLSGYLENNIAPAEGIDSP